MAPEIAVADLNRLFTQTAGAAAQAQSALDIYSLERTRVFSLPTINVRARFALNNKTGGWLGLIFGSTTEQNSHTLEFSLRAMPVAPSAANSTIGGGGAVFQPGWMVSVADRLHFADLLTIALRTGGCVIAVPGLPRVPDLYPEAAAIDRALSNTDDDSIGVVFFRLSSDPEEYLIVRVGDGGMRNGHDGIFLLRPADASPVTVYDYLNSPKNAPISATPFDRLFTLLSQWTGAGMPAVLVANEKIPSTFGSIDFGAFARGLTASYVAARRSAAATDPNQRAVYALEGVSAEFAHAVPPPDSSEQRDSPFIASRITLEIEDSRLTSRLICPEYLLAGDARDAFFAQLSAATAAAAGVAGEAERDAWRLALSSRGARQSALAALSYRGGTPKNQFLFAAQAPWNGRPSWLAFICEFDDGALSGFAPVKLLAASSLDRAGYIGIHNFLHAIRIWEMAGKWFVAV